MLKDTDKLDFLTNLVVAVRLKVAEKALNFQDGLDFLLKMRLSGVAE